MFLHYADTPPLSDLNRFAIGDEFVRHGNIETFVHASTESTEEQLEALMEAGNDKVQLAFIPSVRRGFSRITLPLL